LRTNFKGEDLYLYRLVEPAGEARARFMEYIDRLNELYVCPAWYNAVTANCTTSIRAQRAAARRVPWDWRMLFNGFADEMLYERHSLAGDLPFAELKSRARINERARAAGDAADIGMRARGIARRKAIRMPSSKRASAALDTSRLLPGFRAARQVR